MKVHTNNVPREVIHECELTEDEQKEFDYLDWEAMKRGEDSRDFFRYKGELYDLNEFQTTSSPWANRPAEFDNWDGCQSDSFFSGLLIRWHREDGRIDTDFVVVGWYIS